MIVLMKETHHIYNFAPLVVNSCDKEGGKVPRSAKCIAFENSDLTSSYYNNK